MDSNDPRPSSADNPASAFAELRGEVSLLRRAVEGLTAERQNAPDYTPTLKSLSGRLTGIEGFLGKISESPAMRLTPESLATSIAKASETARAGDRDTIRQASDTLRTSVISIKGVVEQAWTADRQNRWLIAVGLAGALFGIVLWSVVPGEIARALPASWHLPEKMAARTLRLDMRAAGERLIAESDRHRNTVEAYQRAERPIEAPEQAVKRRR